MATVLVVDDSATVRMQAGKVLSGAGFEVIHAVDGVDALEQLAQRTDVSLILCDVNMPRMNGIELVEAIAEKGGTNIPVIMLTTEVRADFVQRAKAVGAKTWMTKPFNRDVLVAAATRLTTSPA